MTATILLENPKYPHNVGNVIRACACYGVERLIVTGGRVSLEPYDGYRLPREERMRDYKTVQVIGANGSRPLDDYAGQTLVGVELVPGAIPLPVYPHYENAVYVFGPEDGSISKGMRTALHHFIIIPTKYCLNLSSAVATVLYDREAKQENWLPVEDSNPDYNVQSVV